jgi:hypothetical protein
MEGMYPFVTSKQDLPGIFVGLGKFYGRFVRNKK